MATTSQQVTFDRLDFLITWYDESARRQQYFYKGLKLVTIAASGAIPVIVAAAAPALIAAALGSVVLAVESIQQVWSFHDQWFAHRFTAEALKREKHLFAAGVTPYENSSNSVRRLALRTEALVSQETAAWRDLEAARSADGRRAVPTKDTD